MGQITALEPQKKFASRRTKRVNLFLDGKFVLGLDLETVLKEKLEVGKELTPQDLKYLTEVSGHQKLLAKAFRFLSFRPRSEKETRDFLARKKIDSQEAEKVIEELRNGKYLDDEEFAKWWIEQRAILQPKGWRALKMELEGKGVAKEIIESIKGQRSGILEAEAAKKVVEKKWRMLNRLPQKEAKNKLLAALARRGFDWEIAKIAIDEILKKK